ncbi:unnamed protein product [Pleuronectes platessa]|uniref:Uncharacterized protein n=1 Tax=Pleuronectes platessa TaxID=8262 RepID=A0A9N7UAW3_PLEPL|nr:unnamed protein product [Pleuronectes platessa]
MASEVSAARVTQRHPRVCQLSGARQRGGDIHAGWKGQEVAPAQTPDSLFEFKTMNKVTARGSDVGGRVSPPPPPAVYPSLPPSLLPSLPVVSVQSSAPH